MLCATDPAEAYRRVEFDACVAGSDSHALVMLCIEDVRSALTRALWGESHGRNDVTQAALRRAHNGLGALRLGVDASVPLGQQLLTLYGAMTDSVVACRTRFNREALARIIADLSDIAEACGAQRPRN